MLGGDGTVDTSSREVVGKVWIRNGCGLRDGSDSTSCVVAN